MNRAACRLFSNASAKTGRSSTCIHRPTIRRRRGPCCRQKSYRRKLQKRRPDKPEQEVNPKFVPPLSRPCPTPAWDREIVEFKAVTAVFGPCPTIFRKSFYAYQRA